MPSTYAHYRMGEQVRKLLSEDRQEIITRYPQLYRIGLHGPDILFYYKPLTSVPVNRIGYELHEASGRSFFDHARKVIRAHDGDERYLAYTYGLLTHFALDLACHGYVEEKIEQSGISHTEIEVEFDRYLMLRDKIDPLSNLTSKHIAATKENAKVITAFYPGTGWEDILNSLRGMILVHKLLLCPGALKRKALYGSLRLLHRYEDMAEHIMKVEANPECKDSNKELYKRYKQGRYNAALFINGFDLEERYPGLVDQLFDYNFSSVLVEMENESDE